MQHELKKKKRSSHTSYLWDKNWEQQLRQPEIQAKVFTSDYEANGMGCGNRTVPYNGMRTGVECAAMCDQLTFLASQRPVSTGAPSMSLLSLSSINNAYSVL